MAESFLSATVTGECNPSALNTKTFISLPIPADVKGVEGDIADQ